MPDHSTTPEKSRAIDDVLDLLAEAVLKDAIEQNGSIPTGNSTEAPEEP